MANEQPTDRKDSLWGGRLAVILIFAFTGIVLALMFLAARGPR